MRVPAMDKPRLVLTTVGWEVLFVLLISLTFFLIILTQILFYHSFNLEGNRQLPI
jgi:hypothetical protein